ncbi:MAG TPA: PHP domain-containing protein [Candidatus Hydrogenedentes bacterium]|nr:PHP domain-containing protein [Candidatus Hydrogenedentota bacterium]
MTDIRNEHLFFDVTPKVVPAGRLTPIDIAPLFDHVRFKESAEYFLGFHPLEAFDGERTTSSDPVPVKPTDGRLRVVRPFDHEQEYALTLEERVGSERGETWDFRVYALDEDLYVRRPFKGDFHIHSCRSDGKEPPGYVAAACRAIGLDFMAVTDHGLYRPSIEAQDAFAGTPIDLRIFPGEEAHPPENPVHIVNFGGNVAVNDLMGQDAYAREVAALERDLGPLPFGVDPRHYASACWCFSKIRETGGLAIFCHPFWIPQYQYTPPGPLTAHLFDTQPFDAYEVIGGFYLDETESNMLQVARYHEERAKGRRIPIVAGSDAHGCETGDLHGWYYSVVFAASTRLEDIIDGVKTLYSVAIEALPGETPRAHGPFRLVKYALFLLREVFPQHDELCIEEGRLMRAHLARDPDAAQQLARLKGRVAALYGRYWGYPA